MGASPKLRGRRDKPQKGARAARSGSTLDHDGRSHLFVCNAGAPNQLFNNNADGNIHRHRGLGGVAVPEETLSWSCRATLMATDHGSGHLPPAPGKFSQRLVKVITSHLDGLDIRVIWVLLQTSMRCNPRFWCWAGSRGIELFLGDGHATSSRANTFA